MKERWLPVVGYEGLYEVSNHGRVRSLDRITTDIIGRQRLFKGQLLNPNLTAPYPCVNLRSRVWRVHKLVMTAFVGPTPVGAQQIRHLNGNSYDCRLENLAYGTASENQFDRVRHGNNHWANRTECINGHPWNAENTRLIRRKDGSLRQRSCLKCRRDRAARKGAAA